MGERKRQRGERGARKEGRGRKETEIRNITRITLLHIQGNSATIASIRLLPSRGIFCFIKKVERPPENVPVPFTYA